MKPAVSSQKRSKVGVKFKSTPDSRYPWMKNGGHVTGKAVEAERRDTLVDPNSPFPDRAKVAQLKQLAGIGELSATLLVAEVFHRRFSSRRHLASYLALPRPLMPAAMFNVTRGSPRPETNRQEHCSSRLPGLGCGISR
jgi:hypothetical protein